MEHFLFLCHIHHVHRIPFHNASIRVTGKWPPPLPSLISDQRLWNALKNFVKGTGRLRLGEQRDTALPSQATVQPHRYTRKYGNPRQQALNPDTAPAPTRRCFRRL